MFLISRICGQKLYNLCTYLDKHLITILGINYISIYVNNDEYPFAAVPTTVPTIDRLNAVRIISSEKRFVSVSKLSKS